MNRTCGVVFLVLCGVLLGPGLSACHGEPELASEAVLRRLTETQYRQSVADIFGSEIEVIGRFEPDMRVEGLLASGTTLVSITPGGMEQYEAIAREVARQVVAPEHRARLIGCAPVAGDPNGQACARAFFRRTGTRLFRRPLSEEEIGQAANLALSAAQQLGDFHTGIAASLAGMLTSPDFLFRIDRVAADGAATARLDGWSKATRLSYFLWNTTPDEALLAAAQRGDLDTEEGLAKEVARMMDSPRFAEGVRAFFDDFLQLDGLENLSKDALIYPAFGSTVAADAREQTLRSVIDLLVARRGDFRDLFTDRRLAMNRRLGPIYDVPVAEAEGWVMHQFPEDDPRAGLLTHISFLALHSHPGRTSPTLRGKALRETLMCEKIPTPPANVNFTIVQDVTNPNLKTTRARVEAHLSDEECASCHRLTDPVGLALEKFDGLGQFRRNENGSPIDTSGQLEELAFEDAAGLGAVLRENPAVISCLVQGTWRYATGRGPEREDRKLLDHFERRFKADGYRVPELMRLIATSRSFYAAKTADGSTAAGSVYTSKPGEQS